MSSILSIKGQLERSGFLKANKFKVEFTGPATLQTDTATTDEVQTLVNLYCYSASLPSSNFSTYGWVEKGVPLEIPYQKTFSDFSTSHWIDSDFSTRDYFNKWQSLIMGLDGNFGFIDDYVGSVKIYQYDEEGRPQATWAIDRIWPVIVGPVQLAFDTNDTVSIFEVTWKFNIVQLETH